MKAGDVYIMAVDNKSGENTLEMVNEDEVEKVFDEFKKRTKSDCEFID